METKDIKQSVIFETTREKVFEALLDGQKHAEFTGATAKIDTILMENSMFMTVIVMAIILNW